MIDKANDPKKYFREYHENLHSRIVGLAIKFRILEFSVNVGVKDQDLESWNEFSEFFEPIKECLRTDIIVTLHKLFDERKKGRSLIDYLKEVKKYIRGVRGQSTADVELESLTAELDAQIQRAKSLGPIVDSVKFSRNKYYAHFEGKYFDKPEALAADRSLNFSDVLKLLEFCREVLNWHEARVFDCSVTMWLEDSGQKKLELLLCYIRRYHKLCEEIQRRVGPDELQMIL